MKIDTNNPIPLEGVQRINQTTILHSIFKKGLSSRKQISIETGLDTATVSRSVVPLIENGIIEEVGMSKGARGRGSINLDFTSSGRYFLCLRIQRRDFSVAINNLKGEVIDTQTVDISINKSIDMTFSEIISIMNNYFKKYKHVDGIGVAVPGPFLEFNEKIILITENPTFQGFDFIKSLRSEYPETPIYSIHDAKAAGISEWRYHSMKQEEGVLLYISAGQGIGSSIVVNGVPFRGADGLAGELGHTSINIDGPKCKCGNKGCLELYASRITLIENINQRITKEEGFNDQKLFDFNSLLEGYLSGNMLEVEEVSKVAKYLALGISNCINFVNPSMVVIGDEFSHFGESFLQTIKTEVKMRLLSKTYETVEIMLSSKKNDSVLEGAFINSMTKTYLNP